MKTAPLPATRVVPWAYAPGRLRLLDQRLLPWREEWLECETALQTAEAIRSLAVRGAPLIGVAAAFGLAAEAHRVASRSQGDLEFALDVAAERLAASRPTAVNLKGAVDRLMAVFRATAALPARARADRLADEAAALAREDDAACLEIGRLGADWIEARLAAAPARETLTLLTHCNAGALATAGIGTALGVVRSLAARRRVRVFADETRPFWQGARLTAWELVQDGIETTVLPDVAAASILAAGRVDAVVVGADRIAANGDVANKVGTYGVALACRRHGVPFVVAAPTTTLDLATPTGASIPIELRGADEVLLVKPPGAPVFRLAPESATAAYPAFDVTPADLVDAIVTERGISTPPHGATLATLLRVTPEPTHPRGGGLGEPPPRGSPGPC